MSLDAIVIGGGILGCSAAWRLAERGLRVVVVEREDAVGRGSTSRSTAIIRQRYSHPAAIALAVEGLRTWELWPELVPAAPDGRRAQLRKVGVLFLLPRDERGTRPLAAVMRSVGANADVLTRDQLASAFPSLHFGADEAVEGLHEPDGGYVDDPERATADAARAAAARGVEFRTAARVAEVLTRWGDGGLVVEGVRLAGGERLAAPVVVNCAGPHSAHVNLLARTPLPLTTAPLRQMVVTGTAPELREPRGPLPVIADLLGGFYLRPDPDRVRVGAVWARDETEFLADPDGADPVVPADVIAGRLAAARARVPSLEVRDAAGLVGVYDVTAQDWYPIVDRTETRGYFVAIGTSGAWFKAGPVIGRLAAEIVFAQLDGRDTDAEPLEIALPLTGFPFPMSLFSRRRRPVELQYGGGVLG